MLSMVIEVCCKEIDVFNSFPTFIRSACCLRDYSSFLVFNPMYITSFNALELVAKLTILTSNMLFLRKMDFSFMPVITF